MVYYLNSKVKIHAEDPLQYIFDENKEKIVVLGYSIVSRRSPQHLPLLKGALQRSLVGRLLQGSHSHCELSIACEGFL